MSKKPVKRVLAFMLALAVMAAGIMVTPSSAEAAATKPKSIKLNASSVTLNRGSKKPTFTLKVVSTNPASASKSVSFSSKPKSVATVNSKGVVTGRKKGTATVTVTSKVDKKVKATCKVTVAQKVTGIKLNKKAAVIRKNEKLTLSARVSPSGANNKKVTWKSSKSGVVSVNSKGVITGKKAGTATITVTARDGSKQKAACVVGVCTAKVKNAKINKSKLTLDIGKTYTLKISSVSPKGASDVFTWKSNKTSVASVDAVSGKVTANKTGTAKITGTAADGSRKTVTCDITVTQPVNSVKLDKTSLSMSVDEKQMLTATVAPSKATEKNITWSITKTSRENVVTLSETNTTSSKGVTVTAKNAGTATITARSKNGKTASCSVTVNPKKIPVTGVKLNKNKLSLVVGGSPNAETLIATVSPDNAVNKNVTWESSKPGVATVSNGKVTAVSAGTAIITVTTADGGKKDTCEVQVVEKESENSQYKLVWEDNFDGEELNLDNWNYEYHEPGWVNNELQEYVDSPENIYVKDGELVIQAHKTENEDGVQYTSGRINTQGKQDYKYGRFEARLKVPSGQGFLPAFWMMPTDENLYGQWPKCGEIDIMEVLGNQTKEAHGTLHFGEPHTQSQGSYELEKGDFASEYHIFTCEWEPGEIRFYIDGTLYHTENDWFTKKAGFGEVTYPAPYDQPFYMILNLAVGGNWPGNPDETAQFDENATLRVDYVKVYQKESYDENVSKPVKEVEFRAPDENGNYIINGDFSTAENLQDKENWGLLLAGGGEAAAEISEGALHITTTDAGTLNYSVQVVQTGLPMIPGSKYRLSYDAYASEARTMITAITAPDRGYIRYLGDTSVDLTTEVLNYEHEFDFMASGDANGRLEFNLGNQGSAADVIISNVKLERIGDAEEEVKGVLPDGNYVYNGEFQHGRDRMDYWTVDNQCEGAQVSVTNVNNVRELKVTVPESIQETEQVIVEQKPIAITSGKKYVFSFDAYADGNKTIQAQVAGETFENELTTNRNTFKYTLDMTDSQDEGDGTDGVQEQTALQFIFNTAGEFYIDNVRIQEDSLLINGDFSNGMTGYEVYANTPSDVSYVVDSLNENNAFSIDIKNTGDADWKIQLKQNNIKLENGKWYEISLDAKSTMDRKIMYALQRDGSADDDWTPYSGSQIIALANEYQTFSTTFQMTNETDPATILSISMGAVSGEQITTKHTVRIDNISLEEVDAPEQEEIPAGTELIKNGNFADGGTNWIPAVTSPGEATITFSEGKAVCEITNVGTEDWHVQLKQGGLHLEKGASYEVKFKVKSTAARTIKFALLNKVYDWYGGDDIGLEENMEKEVTNTITVSKTSDPAIDFVISMGKIADMDTSASTIEISDVDVIKK